jgi:hypothetical protein
MQLKTQSNGDIAGGAVHWIDRYSSKVPEFLHASKKTLGNTEAEWRFGTEDLYVKFNVITEDLSFYEAVVGYHADGTNFRLNDTPDLGNLILKTRAGKCRFYRISQAAFTVAYLLELTCKLIEEGIT